MAKKTALIEAHIKTCYEYIAEYNQHLIFEINFCDINMKKEMRKKKGFKYRVILLFYVNES